MMTSSSSKSSPTFKRTYIRVLTLGLSSLSAAAAADSPDPSASWKLTDMQNITFDDSLKYTCSGFQVTTKCDPHNGKPEKRLGCSDDVEAGMSGYCMCKRPDKKVSNVRHENCNHVKFTCEDTCKRFNEFKCRRFVVTEQCNDVPKPEDQLKAGPEKALPCDKDIEVKMKGYCECGDGRLIVPGQCKKPELSVKTTCARVCQRGPTPYEELGTHKHAPEALLKSNFRKMSLKYHPDKRPNDKDKFNGIREAMDLLGDPTTKVLFDQGSYDLVAKQKNNKLEQGEHLNVDLHVSLEAMYLGKQMQMNLGGITRICGGCHKTKSKSDFCVKECRKECPAEVEIGWIQQGNMRFQTQNEVPSKLKCREDKANFEIEVEKGMKNGDTIRHVAASHQKNNHVPGDVVFKIVQSKHPLFTRKGNNLMVKKKITVLESLLGFVREIKHLDGRTIKFTIENGMTPHGARLRVKEEGMLDKRTGTYGDMILVVEVVYPVGKKIPAEHRDAVKKALDGMGGIGKQEL